MLSRDHLPNDIEQLKDIIMEMQTLYESRIQSLEDQLQQPLCQQYGQRSEKQKPAKKQPASDKKVTPHGCTSLPDDLPWRKRVCTLPAEQLDYDPGHLKVIRHKRQKYACQEQQFARQSMLVSRSNFGDWIRQCAQQLDPIVEAMKPDAFKASKLHTDDTTVPVQAEGKTKLGRLWIYLSQIRCHPVIALYDYSPRRWWISIRYCLITGSL